MLSVSGVSRSYGAQIVLRDVSLRVLPGRRIAIVGSNGAGKTTLLRVLAGVEPPDTGAVARDQGVTVGYLEQDVAPRTGPGTTVLDAVLAGATEVREVERRLRELESRGLGMVAGDEGDRTLEEYGRLQDRFTHLGGYDLEPQAHRVLAGLGFAPADAGRDVGELSGGWMVRVALARQLLAHPDVLLLDEPTNHLDVESAAWLEQFLRGYDGAVVLVSHDRDLIQAVATAVVEIVHGAVHEYAGAYDDFVAAREQRVEQARRARAHQDARIDQLERFVERFRYKASKASQAQSKLKQIERLQSDRVEVPGVNRRAARFGFPAPPRSGRVVAELTGVRKAFGDTVVYDGLDLVVERGQRVALVGPNGSGKTTLLRLLAGQVAADAGMVERGHNVEVAYYAQHQADTLESSRTVLDEFLHGLSTEEQRRLDARRILGGFLFPGDEVDKPVAVLSGGERARLVLAKLMVRPANLLCLDEPTNHLDIPSRDVLEEALTEYAGTLVLVTHDRHLIRSVADTIVDVREGGAAVHAGGWEDYVRRLDPARAEREGAPRPTSRRAPGGGGAPPAGSAVPAKERKHREAELRNRLYRETRDLRERVDRLEQALEQAEGEVAELNRELARPGVYDDEQRVKELVARHGEAKDRAGRLMAEWEQAQLELDEATRAVEDELAAADQA